MRNYILLLVKLLVITTITSSCRVMGRMEIFSDNRYVPIADVDTKHYKSVQERESQDPHLALGLSISGGGSRAQYFGLGVLMALDELKSEQGSSFLNEVDYFSTVSGGGFAAGYYLTLKKHKMLEERSLLS